MGITEKELKNILRINSEIEKITTISSDGKNLLTRIPKDVCEYLNLKKGKKIRWFVNDNKKIKIFFENEN
ncbi:MAG: hypothetical protein QXW97_04115 [Candidatus Pacearchaeota archaeon]